MKDETPFANSMILMAMLWTTTLKIKLIVIVIMIR